MSTLLTRFGSPAPEEVHCKLARRWAPGVVKVHCREQPWFEATAHPVTLPRQAPANQRLPLSAHGHGLAPCWFHFDLESLDAETGA